MSILLFLRGLCAVLLVFAIVTYAVTQSVWTTFIQTVLCAVLLQIGYFVAVLFLVWRTGTKSAHSASKTEQPQIAPNPERPAGDTSGLSGMPGSRLP